MILNYLFYIGKCAVICQMSTVTLWLSVLFLVLANLSYLETNLLNFGFNWRWVITSFCKLLLQYFVIALDLTVCWTDSFGTQYLTGRYTFFRVTLGGWILHEDRIICLCSSYNIELFVASVVHLCKLKRLTGNIHMMYTHIYIYTYIYIHIDR